MGKNPGLPRRTKVKFKRRKDKDEDVSSSTGAGERNWYNCNFSIEFENKTTVDFNDIEIEYVIFYTQDHYIRKNTDKEKKHGTLYKRETISLPKKSTEEFETEKILLYHRKPSYMGKPDLKGKLQGIILTLSMKSDTGEAISRRIKFPDNLNHIWTPSTKNVQIAPY